MADISKVTLPDSSQYNLKDAWLRETVGELPAPYTQVEWVESNGQQFVYLDWKPPIATWGFEADFIIKNTFNTTQAAWNPSTNASNSGFLFGTQNSSQNNDIQVGAYSSTGFCRIGGTAGGSASTYNVGWKTDKSRQTMKLHGTTFTKPDGTTMTVTRASEVANKPYANMTVFCYHSGNRKSGTGNLAYPSTSRIYSLKFYDGADLKVDLVGAVRKSDGCTGLWDKVSGHFYPAAGMTYGAVVGDLGDIPTIAERDLAEEPNLIADNTAATRMWRVNAPTLSKLEDGQTIVVTPRYNVAASTQTTELAGWDDTSSNSNVYIKLTLKDGTTTDWVPCYYSNTGRLTSHYGGGHPIRMTYRENAAQAASATSITSVMRGWWADPNYNTDSVFTRHTDAFIAGLNGAKRYTLCMKDVNGYWTSIVNEGNNANATGKTCYTGGLQPFEVTYHSTAAEYAAGANAGVLWDSNTVDLRFSVNGVTTAAATTTLQLRKPVYLVGTIDDDDGLFYLDTTLWWTQAPSDTSKVYVYIGYAYTSYYYIYLSACKTVYTYDGTRLVEYDHGRIRALEEGVEELQGDASSMKIGARNYLLGTEMSKGPSAAASYLITYALSSKKSELSSADEVTVSFDIQATSAKWVDCYWRTAAGGSGTGYAQTDSFYPSFYIETANTWMHFEATGVAGPYITNANVLAFRNSSTEHGSAGTPVITVRNVQLERGNRATDWVPAPEDIDSAISAVDAKAGVTGVKGNAESSYRTGQVNLTYANLGTAPVANGGTGQTSGVNAANYFLNELSTGSSDPSDNDYYISQYANGGTTTTTYHRRPVSKLWNYIKSKISSWMKNNTSKGALGWSSSTNDTMPITSNTLAYWNGAYQNTTSNLTYCVKGAFGTASVADLSDSTSSSSSTAAASSKAVSDALTAAKTYADDGGRNYLLDSGNLTKWSKESGVTVSWNSTYGMYEIYDTTHTSGKWGIYKDFDIEPSTTYTLSLWALAGEVTPYVGIGSFAGNPTWPSKVITPTTTKTKHTYTWTTGDTHTKARIYLAQFPVSGGANKTYFHLPKLERGQHYTDWSPAPEDVDVAIAAVDAKSGVTGVKGNAESTYRTGQVNLTAGNVGAVAKSGDTMTGNLVAPSVRIANTYYGLTFGRTTGTPVETILYTGIKWLNGSHMPVIHVTGYAYGLQSPVEFKIGFYIYGGKVGYCGVCNMGAWNPDVYLFKHTRDNVDYIAVGFSGSCYYLQLQADVQDEMGKFAYTDLSSAAWSWSFLTTTGTIPTDDGGTTSIKVPYKVDVKAPNVSNAKGTLPIANGGTGATTAAAAWTALGGGAIGKKASLAASDIPNLSTDKLTSGTLSVARGGTGKDTHTSNAVLTGNGASAVNNVATASGAFYATAANGAPSFGTLPIAQGGTGATTAAAAWTALGGGAIGKKASLAASDIPAHAASATTYGAGSDSNYGHVKLSASTSSTSGTGGGIAATPSAVKSAYDLANTANTTANGALSVAQGALVFDTTYEIDEVGGTPYASFEAHVYQGGVDVTSGFDSTSFTWYLRLGTSLDNDLIYLTDGTSVDVPFDTVSVGFGGSVICYFDDGN